MNFRLFQTLWICSVSISFVIPFSWADDRSKGRSQRLTKKIHAASADRDNQRSKLNSPSPASFRESCYRAGTAIPFGVSAPFLASPYQWPQPDGPGSAITLTYSYSNLLDGKISELSDSTLRAIIEEALSVWASYAPITFIEVKDNGPDPTGNESSYAAANRPNIRIGTHAIDGSQGGELAHAYLPYSLTDGLAGDLHIDSEEDWTENNGGFLLEVVLHELGHVLGLDHVENVDAIMNPFASDRFSGLGQADLLPDDIQGIRAIYGEGIGSVVPLVDDGSDPPDQGDNESSENDVSVTFDDATGLLDIAGDAANNQLVIQSSPWHIALLGLNGTTINGTTFQSYFSTADKSIACDLGDGDDAILLWGTQADELTCVLGTGDDLAAIFFSRLNAIAIDGGDGEDQFIEIFNAFVTLDNIGFE